MKHSLIYITAGNVFITDQSDGSTHRVHVPNTFARAQNLPTGGTTEVHWFETMGDATGLVCLSVNVSHIVAAVSTESMVFVNTNWASFASG